MQPLPALVLPFLAVAASQDSEAEIWSRFRGPNGSGVLETQNLPAELAKDTALWRCPLPKGFSSPVLSDSLVFLTGAEGEKLLTFAVDRATGKVVWKKEAPRDRKEKLDSRNDPASPSAVVDEDVVVVFFPDFGLLAYDHRGEELWRRALGPFTNVYGMGASPILYENSVLLACDQAVGSYLAAFDKLDGSELWRSERPQAKSSHCTPVFYDAGESKPQLILPGSFLLDAYDPTTGAKLWWAEGLCFEMKSVPVIADGLILVNGYGSPMNQPGSQISVPEFAETLAERDANKDGLIAREEMPEGPAANWFDFVDLNLDGGLDESDWSYLSAALASQNGMLAYRPGEKPQGELPAESLAWAYRRSVPQLPSPIVYGDVLYMLNDAGGLITTFRPATGEVLERGRIEEGVGENFYASPVAGDDKLFLATESGVVLVLPGGGSLDPIGVYEFDENIYATPALAEGRVFLRTNEALYAFGASEPGGGGNR